MDDEDIDLEDFQIYNDDDDTESKPKKKGKGKKNKKKKQPVSRFDDSEADESTTYEVSDQGDNEPTPDEEEEDEFDVQIDDGDDDFPVDTVDDDDEEYDEDEDNEDEDNDDDDDDGGYFDEDGDDDEDGGEDEDDYDDGDDDDDDDDGDSGYPGPKPPGISTKNTVISSAPAPPPPAFLKEGIARLSNWQKNADGGVSGRVYGHEDFPEGQHVDTSSIEIGEIRENGVVETSDGEMYLLGKPKRALFGKAVPVTVQGIQDDTGNLLKQTNVNSLFEKNLTIDENADDLDAWASADTGSNFLALRYGNFEFDGEGTGKFVYVPKDYNFSTEEGFSEIMSDLGIRRPDLTFLFKENWGVVPNLDQVETDAYHKMRPREFTENKETWDYRRDLKYPNPTRQRHMKKKIETRVQNIIKALAEACSESTAVFLLTEPHTGNVLSEMACIASKRYNVMTLGLFVAEDFSYVYEDDGEHYGKEQLTLKLNNLDYDEYLSPDHKVPYALFSSTHRWFHDIKTFSNNPDAVVSKGDTPSKAIRINTRRTKQEQSFMNTYRHQNVRNGLANRCSHRLVFEERSDKDHFMMLFADKYPSGFICVGSGAYGLKDSIRSLTNSRPLFVLKNTGATSNAVAELGYLGNKIHRGDFERELEQLELSHREVPDSIKLLTPYQKKADIMDVMNNYIDRHFPPKMGSDEAMHHFFPDRKAGNERDLGRELAIDDFVWDDAKVYAETFSSNAPNFNPDTLEVFDVSMHIDVKDLQNRITKVMSSSFDTLPELGGVEKDKAVMGQTKRLQLAIQAAKDRYRKNANVLQLFIRTVLFLAVLLTVIQSLKPEDSNVYNRLTILNTILPLIGSLLITLDSYFRPSSIYASLLMAEKRIESDTFRYRTRTGEYRVNRSRMGNDNSKYVRIREKFAIHCQDSFDACLKSDFASGSLFSPFNSASNDEKVFGLLTEEDQNRGFADMIFPSSNQSAPFEHDEKSFGSHNSPTDEVEATERGLMRQNSGRSDRSNRSNRSGGSHQASINDDDIPVDVLSADEYIDMRLKPKLIEFYREIPGHALSRFYLRVLIISLTAASAAFASLGLAIWVPVILALAASFEFAYQFMHLDTRVPNLNNCAGELTKVYLWWTGLTLIQTRLPSYKDQLIDRAEDAIVAQYEQYAGATLALSKKNYEEEEDDEDGGGGGNKNNDNNNSSAMDDG